MIARLASLLLWLVAASLIVLGASESHRPIALIAWAVAVLVAVFAVQAWKEGGK